MKKSFLLLFFGIATFGFMLIAACSDDDSPTGPSGSYVSATITHWGFDFSEGKADTTTNWNENGNDGETISWTPIGERYTNGIWFRTRVDPNHTKSLGQIDIDTVKSVDTSESAWDTQPPPLSKGDVVVIECLDGYAKFKVVADVDTSSANYDWGVQVEYLFSSEPAFP